MVAKTISFVARKKVFALDRLRNVTWLNGQKSLGQKPADQ